MTNIKLAIYMGGVLRTFPTYNTRNYFNQDVCFVIHSGNRELYIPCHRNKYNTVYPKSVVLRHSDTDYYFISVKDSLQGIAMLDITWQSHDDGMYTTTTVKFNPTGNTLGLNYKYHITSLGHTGEGFIGDGEFSIEDGTYQRSTKMYNRSLEPFGSESFRITCDISDESYDITIAYATSGALDPQLSFSMFE